MSDYPIYNAILSRRSIRDFKEEKVSHNDIEQMLKAAMAAPSACNLQPWAFIVVDDPELLMQVKEYTEQGKYNAPLIVVVCGIDKHIPWDGEGWRQDCGGAIQNMLLEATELGLGTVCVGGFDEDRISELLEIPNDVYPMCLIEIGYPSYEMKPLTWYTEEAVHWQKYDKEKKREFRTLHMLQEDADAGII